MASLHCCLAGRGGRGSAVGVLEAKRLELGLGLHFDHRRLQAASLLANAGAKGWLLGSGGLSMR